MNCGARGVENRWMVGGGWWMVQKQCPFCTIHHPPPTIHHFGEVSKMSTSPQQPIAAGQQVAVIIPTVPRPVRAFGWPPGSIRALLTLIIVALVCALLLISKHGDPPRPVPIPAYLGYLLMLVVGFY